MVLTIMDHNVKQAVPFFRVKDIQASVKFYSEGLGFQMSNKWIDEGKLQWCWLELGDAALMLQEIRPEHTASFGKLGEGVSICFMCSDAIKIFREANERGVKAKRPFVGNGLWVTTVIDPDGYVLEFESPTDEPEERVYSE
jgi:lactoylglutathione lyase